MGHFKIDDMTGVIPAMITAFNRDEEIDEKGIHSCIDFFLEKKVAGLYITGSTGEAFLMTHEEKKQVVEIIVNYVDGRIPIIAHVGSIGTRLSIDLAQHAQKIGVDAISCLPPFYYSFSSDQIYDYYNDIAESVDLPLIVYNIERAGLMGFEMIKKLSSIKNVKGIKYTATSHFDIMRIKKEIGPSFMIYSGADEMALSGLLSGSDGVIGSYYNLMPEIFIEIYNAIKNNDYLKAKKLQEKANTVILFSVGSAYSVIKKGMEWQGVQSGICRRPFKNYNENEVETLKKNFQQLKKINDLSGINFLDCI